VARGRSTKRRGRKSGALRKWILALGLLALLIGYCSTPRRTLRQWWSEHQGLERVEGLAPTIQAAARESGLDPNLLAGVMMVESRGHVGAESKAGALGLFQLMLPTAVERAELLSLPPPSKRALLSDANLNTRLGANYLAWLCGRFEGDEERALIAYNAGPGRLNRWIADAGSYAAWRDAREQAGDSGVLAYARDVQQYRQRFADRGVIAPTAVRDVPNLSTDSESPAAPALASPAPEFIGPPAPDRQQ
jgi:hypothetical protein